MTEQTIPQPEATSGTTPEVVAGAVPEAAPGVGAQAEPASGPAPQPSKDRGALRALARWTAAVLVCGAVGSGVAYAITTQERTDLPGLSTRDDGRWAYPAVARPPLPPGAPLPFVSENPGRVHYADLAALLVPSPAGARPDTTLGDAKTHVAPTERFLAQYDPSDREELRQALVDHGLRQVVARGWTMPDGTSTRVFLLRFGSSQVVSEVMRTNLSGASEAVVKPLGIESFELLDEAYPADAEADNTSITVFDEGEPRGDEHVRHAYVEAGDVIALVIQSRKGSAPAVPFHQTVVLQDQLLG
ncbi:hypothetical protein [Streptomyces sp. NPDC101132]|uniref:hypothetical protein n=1 Tax=Streptomyces sp. NPDC101132 TaxID=3366110 RepID=UPI0037F8C1BC